ncbi:two-component system sensor histidine kinase UhpB [Methylobacterium sp. BE186]|uniref:ATP-binding protein n=1 Tax=Methylobacterium sp. BE186 TaxID=2817715 RepID=UPI00285DD214|nr:ATP-binding protein [Methylobacterium sp. BE186]MDR7038299.1 two-component system sensor histidine kinase UhpB [Methylobacterium sp. BE186]
MTPSAGTAPTISPRESRLASLWAGLSTRTRLIAVVLAIDVVAALVSCAVIVLNARAAVTVETQASLATVELLVADTIRLAEDSPPDRLLQTLDLRFQALRHVRVSVLDESGRKVGVGLTRFRSDRHIAPRWFAQMIAPGIQQHVLPIVASGRRIGTAQIVTEPLDEIDEVWGYAVALSVTTFCINVAMLVALYLALGRVLAPLGSLADGLTQLERHDYTARLEPPRSRELAVIAERFNGVAEALTEVRAANGRLNRQLLTAQDDERRRTALELHDEFGPCLFALEANAASVSRIALAPSGPDREKLAARAADISMIVGQVQTLNRDLLNRLRPHALGQVPLTECLNLLLRDFARRHPATGFSGDFDGLARGYGDLVDLTVFRCIQESMTNAVRHGQAAHVSAVARETESRSIEISVRDDGTGVKPDHTVGLGLSGMRERVGALGGTFELDNAAPGTVVRITIPADAERGEETGASVPL